MALGTCNHLWVEGHLGSAEITALVRELAPEATNGVVEVFTIGEWTLLAGEREPLVANLSAKLGGRRWIYVEMEPDHDEWSISSSDDDDGSVHRFDDTGAVAVARATLQRLVTMELDPLYQYVEWHYDLDAHTATRGPQTDERWPGITVEYVPLDLPPAPPVAAAKPLPRPITLWPTVLGIAFVAAASVFTTMVAASGSRWFFAICSWIFWTMLAPVLPESLPKGRFRRWLLGAVLLGLAAVGSASLA